MKRFSSLALATLIVLATMNSLGCQSKPPPDAGAAPQNGVGAGGSGTGTNSGDSGTPAP